MPAFIVATVTISQPEAFGRYARMIEGLAERFDGRYLVRGPVGEVLEGDSEPGERIVVLEFPDAERARAFYRSDDYQAAKRERDGAATLRMRLVA